MVLVVLIWYLIMLMSLVLDGWFCYRDSKNLVTRICCEEYGFIDAACWSLLEMKLRRIKDETNNVRFVWRGVDGL